MRLLRPGLPLTRALASALLLVSALGPFGACSDESISSCADCGGPFRLGASVEIVRDDDGFPHIYGASDADVFYGSGYAQASDRLFQMELVRRQLYGRRAEVLGEKYADDDAFIRRLSITPWGQADAADVKKSDPERARLVEAWVAGVNARIAEVRAGDAPTPQGFTELGFEPEPWTFEDPFVISKGIVFQNGNQLEFDLLASLLYAYSPELVDALPFYSPLVDEYIEGTAEGAPYLPPGTASVTPPAPSPIPAARPLPEGGSEKLREMLRRLAPYRPGASNNWAVAPALTESGRSLLCGDPHQPLRSPSLFWVQHMSSQDAGGTLDVIGWSFVGTPGVSIGHNRRVAWTATTNYPDVTDLWDVLVVEDRATIGGVEVPIVSHEETIPVKDGEPVTITVEEIPGYGVLLPSDIVPVPLVDVGHRLLFNWTGYQVTREAQGFFGFDQAQDLDAFEASVDTMALASFNFVAATSDAISYRSSPIVPDRGDPAAHAAYRLLDGADPTTLWTGEYLPLEQMPHARSDRFLVTANNDPFGFTSNGRFDDDPYYFGAYFDPGTRAGRIHQRLEELIAAGGKISITEMQALQQDTTTLLAPEVLAALDEAWAALPSDDALAEFRDRPELASLKATLGAWDQRMQRDGKGALVFEALVNLYIKRVVADDMPLFFGPVADSSPTYAIKFGLIASRDPEAKLMAEGRNYLVLAALSDTAKLFEERFGGVDADVVWSDFHATRFRSESLPIFDGGEVSTHGAEGTVNVSEAKFFDGTDVVERHVSGSGPIYRMVATFDEDGTPRAYFTMPRGNSGEPGDPHWNDLTADWVDGSYRPLRFRRDEVLAAARETVTLEP